MKGAPQCGLPEGSTYRVPGGLRLSVPILHLTQNLVQCRRSPRERGALGLPPQTRNQGHGPEDADRGGPWGPDPGGSTRGETRARCGGGCEPSLGAQPRVAAEHPPVYSKRCEDSERSIFERLKEGGFRLRDGVLFHLYLSASPCGDARLHSPHERAAERE